MTDFCHFSTMTVVLTLNPCVGENLCVVDIFLNEFATMSGEAVSISRCLVDLSLSKQMLAGEGAVLLRKIHLWKQKDASTRAAGRFEF